MFNKRHVNSESKVEPNHGTAGNKFNFRLGCGVFKHYLFPKPSIMETRYIFDNSTETVKYYTFNPANETLAKQPPVLPGRSSARCRVKIQRARCLVAKCLASPNGSSRFLKGSKSFQPEFFENRNNSHKYVRLFLHLIVCILWRESA